MKKLILLSAILLINANLGAAKKTGSLILRIVEDEKDWRENIIKIVLSSPSLDQDEIINNKYHDIKINNLPVGKYNIEITKKGFYPYVLSNVILESNEIVDEEIKLKIISHSRASRIISGDSEDKGENVNNKTSSIFNAEEKESDKTSKANTRCNIIVLVRTEENILPGASVSIKSCEDMSEKYDVAHSNGRAVFRNLQPGKYVISGFMDIFLPFIDLNVQCISGKTVLREEVMVTIPFYTDHTYYDNKQSQKPKGAVVRQFYGDYFDRIPY